LGGQCLHLDVGHGPEKIDAGEWLVDNPCGMGLLLLVQALLIGSGVSGHVDRGYVGVGLPDRLHHGQPVLPGHFNIGNDDIRQGLVKGGKAGPAIIRGKDRMMILGKDGFDNGQNDTGIIDNKNFHTRIPSYDKRL